MKWVLVAAMVGLCAACGNLATPSADLFPVPARDALTFWGHACVYLDVEGVGIVTDPVFDSRFFPRFRRIAAPPRESYAEADVVLLSHAHNDHLSEKSLQTFPENVVILCPEPCVQYLDHVGRTVKAMHPGDTYQVGEVRITAVAVYHPGTRWSLSAASDGGALGYVIETPAGTVFYSGDTEYYAGFSEVGWKYQPDVAILNLNGHLPSSDAARAAWALGAPVVIPAHWGGYKWWLRGGNKRPRDEEGIARLLGDRLLVLDVGESVPLVGPTIRRR